jgi:hypothetical protein
VPDDTLRPLGPLDGRSRDVHVTLTGVTSRKTSEGTRYPYPEFGSDFIEALHRELPAPRHKGIFRSRVCPVCATSLDGIPGTQVGVAVNVALSRIPPISVEVEMPGFRCPGCARSLVSTDDRAIDSDLSDALIAALTSAGIAPG